MGLPGWTAGDRMRAPDTGERAVRPSPQAFPIPTGTRQIPRDMPNGQRQHGCHTSNRTAVCGKSLHEAAGKW
jgi:hypothetical protein